MEVAKEACYVHKLFLQSSCQVLKRQTNEATTYLSSLMAFSRGFELPYVFSHSAYQPGITSYISHECLNHLSHITVSTTPTSDGKQCTWKDMSHMTVPDGWIFSNDL